MSGNFPAFSLSRQYYIGKGLDINYLTSSLFFPHQMFKKKNRVRIFLQDTVVGAAKRRGRDCQGGIGKKTCVKKNLVTSSKNSFFFISCHQFRQILRLLEFRIDLWIKILKREMFFFKFYFFTSIILSENVTHSCFSPFLTRRTPLSPIMVYISTRGSFRRNCFVVVHPTSIYICNHTLKMSFSICAIHFFPFFIQKIKAEFIFIVDLQWNDFLFHIVKKSITSG